MKQGKFLMGNGVLTRLWNQYPDNMEACSAPERDFLPQMDDYFEEAIEQLDPNNQIEDIINISVKNVYKSEAVIEKELAGYKIIDSILFRHLHLEKFVLDFH